MMRVVVAAWPTDTLVSHFEVRAAGFMGTSDVRRQVPIVASKKAGVVKLA